MPTVHVNGVEIYCEVFGEGKPLVLTHGASLNHKQWGPQVEFLSQFYKVIIWDVRGHGYSKLPAGKVESEDFSKDLIGLLDELGIQTAVLTGLSMGGHISLQTAIRYPDRVDGLVLIGTPCSNTFNLYEKTFVPVNRWSSRFVSMKLLAKLTADIFSKINPSSRAYVEEAVMMIAHNDWIRLWDAITRMESKNDLDKVKCPTLLLCGDKDTLTKRQQNYMNTHIKDSRLIMVNNAQHLTNLDNPQEINTHINAFLQEL